MKDLLTEIARRMVDYPDQVKINEIESRQALILELSVAKQDLGKIIGSKGRNIGAIRTIMNAVSAKTHKRVIIEILE
jgi:predicted RNA-binding protein YlqC (UPF0109 family)